jgi:hypothetical protein
MDSEETRRKITFAVAVAALVASAFAMAILDRDEGIDPPSSVASRSGPVRNLPEGERRAPRHGAQMRAAAYSARRFVHAYLRYQEGRFRRTDRESLLLYSTPDLGGQLVRAPVRVPPGSRVPRQFVARIAGVEAGLFDGSPAFLVAVVVAGRT